MHLASAKLDARRRAGRGTEANAHDGQPPAHKRSFTTVAHWAATALGSAAAFACACAVVIVWALAGPFAGFSDAWQLTINTGTTIVTFLMVFLIQNSQNRDARATQLKLDELIRSIDAARNRLIDIEECTDEELDRLQQEFERLRRERGRGRS